MTDHYGETVRSNNFTVTAIKRLEITKQPENATVSQGSNLTVSVEAEGNGLTYQWYFKKAGQAAFSIWNNRTHASETVAPNDTWNGIQLYCKITDASGYSVNSDIATITVTPKPKITQQPTKQTVTLGSSVTLSLKAQGEGLTYQWYFKKSGQTAFSVWNGRTHESETVTPNATWNGIQLYCLVKVSYGGSVKSDTVTVTVNQSVPAITQQPTSKTVTLGNSVTLSLKASGTGLTYQWYFKKAGQTAWSVWNGRTHASETVTPNAMWNGIQLYCIVKDSSGASVKSDTVKVTVNQSALAITTQPASANIKQGSSVTLSLKASGSGLTYQWYFKKAGQTAWSVWNGRTHASETVAPNATWNGIQLYCKVKDSAGASVNSNTVKINFTDVITVVTQPANVTAKAGNNVTFAVKAEGVGLTYQWYYKKSGASDWSVWNGRTTASTTATANATWNGMQVRCVIKNSAGQTVTSNAATITLA